MSDGTADAYFAALRVTLAYTALESLEIAIGCRHQTKIIDSEIANLIRSKHQKLIDVTDKTLKGDAKKEYRLSLQKFIGDDSHDLPQFVYAVRNLMAHGQFTAARFGLTAAANRRKLIHSLADLTMRTVDDRFSIYVKKMRNRT